MSPWPGAARRIWSTAPCWAPAFAAVMALRSYWPWLWRRTVEPGEPWGVVPLTLALAFTASRWGSAVEPPSRIAPPWLAAAGALLIGAIGSWSSLPRLASATFAVLALGCTLIHTLPDGERHRSLGIVALLFLALPIGTALDLFVAFPLRATSAALGGGWLRSAGVDAHRIGVGLVIGDQRSFVDPACSGVRALWSAMVLVAALGTFHRMRWRALAAMAIAALGMVTVANAVRVAALTLVLSAAGHEPPPWLHAGAGLCAFAVVTWGLTWIAERLGGSLTPSEPPVRRLEAARSIAFRARASALWFGSACVLAAQLPPARIEPLPVYGTEPVFPGWPSQWQGAVLEPRPLDWNERRYEHLLPGRSARFRLAGDAGEIVFRWVWAPTRKVHSVRWCYRNEGYVLSDLPAWRDDSGRTWTRFEARDASGRSFEIREIVLTAGDAVREWSWPDAGSWYWNAAFDRSNTGPWWVIAWTVPLVPSGARGA